MRLDIRINKPIKALINFPDNREEIILEGLSLSGALVKNKISIQNDEIVEIIISHKDKKFKLLAEKFRENSQGTVLRFLITERETFQKLWEFILDNLPSLSWERCPYCNSIIRHKVTACPVCHLSLKIASKEYLAHHLKNTLPRRVKILMDKLETEDLFFLYAYLNKSLLVKKNYSEDVEFVGTCPEILEVFSLIRKVAPLDISVLILGESGTGKELVARAIYERSLRSSKPFVVINCAAIPENLLEAELFGYERGAFTGAHAAKPGKIELAHGGTLFLDEIGELPSSLQAKLLRFLEDGVIERLGGSKPRRVDVRIIAATNRDLEAEIANGTFRADLYYRLSVFTIKLPPLRDRGKDKLVLANYFLKKFAKEYRLNPKKLSSEAEKAIMEYHWPGNVRELINRIRKALIISNNNEITPEDLELDGMTNLWKRPRYRTLKKGIDKNRLLEALQENNFNISRTARALGVSRPTIYNLMRRYEINLPR